jgi:hypothetical protein
MNYSEYERLLVRLHDISEQDREAFKGRLRVLRDMNVPNTTACGSGRKIEYGQFETWTTHLALTLSELAVPPQRIADFFQLFVYPSNYYDVILTTLFDEEYILAIHFGINAGKRDNVKEQPMIQNIFRKDLHKLFQQYPFQISATIINITGLTKKVIDLFQNSKII